jgi:hypothetical protein
VRGSGGEKLEELSELWRSNEASSASYTRLKEVATRIDRATCVVVKLNDRCERSSK